MIGRPIIWLVAATVVVPLGATAFVLGAPDVPSEAVAAASVALEVVLLAEAIREGVAERARRRRFSYLLWDLHHELGGHLETVNARMARVRPGTEVKRKPGGAIEGIFAPLVETFPSESWQRFIGAGGLDDLLEYAPGQVAGNLHRYYFGVAAFNRWVATRERLVERAYGMDGRALEGLLRTVGEFDKLLAEWIEEVPQRLAFLLEELQQLLRGFGRLPVVLVGGPADRKLQREGKQEEDRYIRWRKRHGLVPGLPVSIEWNWQRPPETRDGAGGAGSQSPSDTSRKNPR